MNCIIIDDDELSRRVVEEFVKRTEYLHLVKSFPTAVDAINTIQQKEIDLIFLDIEMPEMTGIDLLNSMSSLPQVIIISSKEKYALEAFEYSVTDYLLKPINYGRFIKAVEKSHKNYKSETKKEDSKDEIFIKRNSVLVRLKYDEILWIEALENYVIVNTFDDKFTIHFTMKSIEQKMPDTKFIRIHRSFIVNLNKIETIEDNSVIIKCKEGNKTIPIGKSYKDKLMGDINLIVK